ncbi:acyl carrier protein [Virgisporangium aurantiacum]|uniref:Carrier domain-containing protein n=1 Tax=Virgisporangium aurantiacum TaxID=175570 RepID=A0A8J4E0N4_9ACTN|nr:phosphopantetheine-binding protein [Virgisporangium aurantiacum]GIJ57144.1 hypothetical protein Vau01_046600 [Virgisporangium aurantiacum]
MLAITVDAAEVAAAWSRRLDGHPVTGTDDFFFDLGGNSLLGAAIVADLADRTGLPLELRDLYLAPTPDELAGYLRSLAERLTDLRQQAGDRVWSLDAFATALADLGPAAAGSLLPPDATVRFAPLGATAGPPIGGAARIAELRRARGNGGCERVVGDTGPGVALRRHDRVVRITHSPGPEVLLTEEPVD